MRQGLIGAAAVAAAAAVLVAVGWMLWPRPAAVTVPSAAASTMDASLVQVASAAKANPGRQFILITSAAAAGPAAARPNAVVVPAADASRRIDQAVPALAGTA